MNFKQGIIEFLGFEGLSEADISIPPSIELGDYSLPCFKMAKAFKKPPAKIAEEIADRADLPRFIKQIKALNGYVNFYLNSEVLADTVLGMDTELNQLGKGKTVCIDYSSINIAKPLHIGHLPSTVIGASLKRIFTALGYKVVGINHLGDYGTQFGKLISVYKRLGDDARLERDGIRELQRLYVQYTELEETDKGILDEARGWSLRIERGDKEASEIFNLFKEITLKEVSRIYDRLNITFDSYKGESFFIPFVPMVVKELEDKGLLETSEGARVVSLEDFGMPPCLILRADGASLYATRDIAAAKYRKAEYDFDKCLYVVAYQQNLHFKQFFKVLELMGYEWAKDLHHIAFGMVNVEGQTLSTRKGNTIYLEDVLNKAVERTKEIMRSKREIIDQAEFEKTANAVGIGAVIFSALSSSKIKDVSFDIEKLLNFEGETGPYLQYTHARLSSVLQKAEVDTVRGGQLSKQTDIQGALKETNDCKGIDNPEAYNLLKALYGFEAVVIEASERFEPCIITKYLLDTATRFNKFYFEHTILDPEPSIRASRLRLVRKTKEILAKGLELIMMQPVDKM